MESENVPLIAEIPSSKECVRTRIKVLMYALMYSCALAVTRTIEPQYQYFYIKHNLSNNGTENHTLHNTSSNVASCLTNSTSSDDSIEQLASDRSWYSQMAEAGISLPVVVFSGSLADRIGRKPVLMWNLIISTISFIMKTIIVYKSYNLYFYTLACGVLGLAGSFYTYQITNFAILADVTEEGKDRSFLMSAFDALSAVGSVSFQIGTGYLVQYLGFTDPYIIAAGMFLAITIFVQVSLTDTWKPPKTKTKVKYLKIPIELFSFCLEKENMNPNSRNRHFVMYMVAYCLFYFPFCTATGIRTLLQLGPPFCWTAEYIGWYGAASDFIMFVGGTLILKIIHTCCVNIKDSTISFLGNVSCLSTYLMYGFSTNKWILFGAVGTGMVRALPLSLVRALMSEMVHRGKQGVLYSTIHVMETILRIGSVTLFNNIYHHTLSFYKGFTFFIMAGFVMLSLILLLFPICSVSNRSDNGLIIEQTDIQNTDGRDINTVNSSEEVTN